MTALEELKLLAEERDGGEQSLVPRMYTDAELEKMLALHGGNARKAAYHVLLRKAESTDITLPDGTKLPDQAGHYLRLAASLRGSKSHTMRRADEP